MELQSDTSLPVKEHCPNCNDERNADIIAKHLNDWVDDEHPFDGYEHYFILKCRGCNQVYFKKETYFSGDVEYGYDRDGEVEVFARTKVSYWPSASKRSRPEWLPQQSVLDEDLDALLNEIYLALNNDITTLAAIGIRTAFDKATELLQVDPSKSFMGKLQDLVAKHLIGQDEKNTLDILINAGSAAAHRGWSPNLRDLHTMMAILEQFIYRAFTLRLDAQDLGTRIPPRPKRS